MHFRSLSTLIAGAVVSIMLSTVVVAATSDTSTVLSNDAHSQEAAPSAGYRLSEQERLVLRQLLRTGLFASSLYGEPVPIADVVDAFRTNALTAKNVYSSQPVVVTGAVIKIYKTAAGSPVVVLATPQRGVAGDLAFDESDVTRLARLRAGDQVSAGCSVKATTSGNAEFSGCHFADALAIVKIESFLSGTEPVSDAVFVLAALAVAYNRFDSTSLACRGEDDGKQCLPAIEAAIEADGTGWSKVGEDVREAFLKAGLKFPPSFDGGHSPVVSVPR